MHAVGFLMIASIRFPTSSTAEGTSYIYIRRISIFDYAVTWYALIASAGLNEPDPLKTIFHHEDLQVVPLY